MGRDDASSFQIHAGETLTGRVLETGDLVEVVVIELRDDGLARVLDVPEVDDPPRLLLDRPLDVNLHLIRVAVQS